MLNWFQWYKECIVHKHFGLEKVGVNSRDRHCDRKMVVNQDQWESDASRAQLEGSCIWKPPEGSTKQVFLDYIFPYNKDV